MSKILKVAAREFLETVKSKMFLLSSVFMPLLMTGLMFKTRDFAEMSKDEARATRVIAVRDESGRVFESFSAEIDKYNEQNPKRLYALEKLDDSVSRDAALARIRSAAIYAYLQIPPGALDGSQAGELARADTQLRSGEQIRHLLSDAIIGIRLRDASLPPLAKLREFQTEQQFRYVDAATGNVVEGNEMARVMTPFIFMFLLFMGILNISQGLLTSLIEEKSSRVMEVLLSAVSPLQLMAGKILGMVCVGALLLGIWAAVGSSFARSQNMGQMVTTFRLAYMVAYYIPGFLLFSAILAGLGSACNQLKDAQTLAFPVTLMTIVPMMLWFPISEDPGSTLALSLSFIPPMTPFIMILRICSDPNTPVWQIGLSLALLWASVFVAIWAAAKVFSIGVLMYGKAPSPRELLRWVMRA